MALDVSIWEEGTDAERREHLRAHTGVEGVVYPSSKPNKRPAVYNSQCHIISLHAERYHESSNVETLFF